jgi:hypothetical protein
MPVNVPIYAILFSSLMLIRLRRFLSKYSGEEKA